MGAANLDVHVPAWFACQRLDITQQTLVYWRTSGKLVPVDQDANGRPLYRFGDVLDAERATRRSGKSRRGTTMRRSPVGAAT